MANKSVRSIFCYWKEQRLIDPVWIFDVLSYFPGLEEFRFKTGGVSFVKVSDLVPILKRIQSTIKVLRVDYHLLDV